MCGVYMIKSRTLEWLYIGGTTMPFSKRWANHKISLGQGLAPRKLQAAYELFGLDDLEFVPLKELPAAQVGDYERDAIERLQPRLNTHGCEGGDHHVFHRAPKKIELVEYHGRKLTAYALSAQVEVSPQTILARHRRGLRDDDLVAPPHKAPRKNYTRRK